MSLETFGIGLKKNKSAKDLGKVPNHRSSFNRQMSSDSNEKISSWTQPKKPQLPMIQNMAQATPSEIKTSQTSRPASISSFRTMGKLVQKNMIPSPPAKMQPIFGAKIPQTPDRVLAKAEEDLNLATEMDGFFLTLSHESIYSTVEFFVQEYLNAGQVIFWQVITSIQRFYSYRLNLSFPHNAGLLGFSFQSRTVITIPVANQHEWYDQTVDGLVINPQTSLVLFPLFDSFNNLVGIVEVSKKANDAIVSKSDLSFIDSFQKKFRAFSHWIMKTETNPNECFDLMHLMETEQFILLFKRKMNEVFECRVAEIWSCNVEENEFVCYSDEIKKVDKNMAGIVGDVVHKQEQVFNCYMNNLQSSYNSITDGKIEEPILAIPFIDPSDKKVHVIMVRGQRNHKIFTSVDEERLLQMSPFIFSSFKNSLYLNDYHNSDIGNEKLAESLFHVLPKTNQKKRPQDVLDTSMRELKNFTKADRVTYYEIDRERNVLRSVYFEGMKDRIQVPIGTGQCGIAAKKGIVLNTANAYEDKFFDPIYDKFSQYKTKTLLSVPIINANGAVGALIQLLNKQDSKPFSSSDIGATQIFGVVCMSLLSTSTLLTDLNDSSRRLEGINNALEILAKNENVYDLVSESIKSVIQCEYTVIYTFDKAALQFHPLGSAGNRTFSDLSSIKGIAAEIKELKHEVFLTNDVKNHEGLANELEEEKKFIISLLICPIINKAGKVIGMIRAINKRGLFDKRDSRTLNDYAKIISIVHEDHIIQRINQNGVAQVKIDKWINVGEYGSCCIPQMLRLPDDQISMMTKIDFNTLGWNNNGLFQIVFYAFGSLSFLTRLKIPNDTLFAFMYYCRQEYNKNTEATFHSWSRAVEMVQFLLYMMNVTKLASTLPTKDQFAMFLATIGCFIGHNGTNNRFHTQTETTYGMALPPDKVIETISIMKLSNLISQQNQSSNIMKNLSEEEIKYVWRLVIKLIQISDLERNFEVIDKAELRLKNTTLDLRNEEDRDAFAVLLFRATLLSVYCRPFLISQKWHDLEVTEMLELGDKEELGKMEYSTQQNCREIHNKTDHSIDVIEKKVLPLLTILQKSLPDLSEAFSSANSNLKTWIHLKNTKTESEET